MSVQAEQAVLGGLMLAPDAWWTVGATLTPEDFTHEWHRAIFAAIADLAERRQPFDAVTLGEWFEARGMAHLVQGGAYLIELASTTPSAANVAAYADIVAERSRLRRLSAAGQAAMQAAMNPDGRTAAELVAEMQRDLIALASDKRQRLKTIRDGIRAMTDRMQVLYANGGQAGVSYGLPSLDYHTGGKKPGDLVILAARPSMGKTTLALQGALHSRRPLIFSFETSEAMLTARMTAHLGHFPLSWITRPVDAPEYALTRIADAAEQLRDRMHGLIYDGRRLTFEEMRAIAIREHAREPLTEIVTDHLGHVKLAGKGRTDLEMGEVTKGHKELARELGVPCVLLMQLNRGVEARADKRPMLSDLRECGAAEEDADVVAMLYRDRYYNPQTSLGDHVEIFLRKNRDGEPAECWAQAQLSEMRFDPAEPQPRPDSRPAPTGSDRRGAPGIRPRSQSRPLSVVSGGD